MNADKFHTVRENYYHSISSNEIVHEKDTTEASNSLDLIAIATIALIGISIYLVRLGAARSLRSRFPKTSTNFSKAFKDSTQTNCTNCRFFDSNSYLKCAVHPSKVLKKSARECLDYEAEH